jgi:3-oxoacyl-[acyl-carrier protein] reductase
MDFSGQVAVVTGGARGIGYAIAAGLLNRGARVCLIDLNASDLDAAAKKLGSAIPRAEIMSALTPPAPPAPAAAEAADCRAAHAMDVSNVDAAAAMVRAVVGRWGRLDVLAQAAGITGKTNLKTDEVDPNDFDTVMRVNLRGIFVLCRAVLPTMARQRYGRIVNIASVAGKEGNAGMLAYSTSKSAVIGLTKVIGKEYAEQGITCNCLAPAVVRTEMVAAMPAEQVKYMTDKIPMKRTGELDELSSMVCFIASRSCSFTTGFCFDATGGRSVY